MKSNRRDFLKTATFVGAGAMTGSLISGCTPKEAESNLAVILQPGTLLGSASVGA